MQNLVILLVDDDELQLSILGIQLANLGYQNVILSHNGEEALAKFKCHGAKIDIIISDLAPPALCPPSICRWTRRSTWPCQNNYCIWCIQPICNRQT